MSEEIDFRNYQSDDWLASRDDRFPGAGKLVSHEQGVVNEIPDGTSDKDLLNVTDGAGFALRLLRNFEIADGHVELDLTLHGTAAPSIYFRTTVEDDCHVETYSLVVFNHTSVTPGYQGINLWKWSDERWQDHVPTEGKWACIGHWRFDIPLEERLTLGATFVGPHIQVFLNGVMRGSVVDTIPYLSGGVGVCAIEGLSVFHALRVTGN